MRASGIYALALVGAWACLLPRSAADEDDAAWLTDVDAAFRLARQHNRPIFAVLH
jgi:hypothetical protein